jgi:hypothetical protein
MVLLVCLFLSDCGLAGQDASTQTNTYSLMARNHVNQHVDAGWAKAEVTFPANKDESILVELPVPKFDARLELQSPDGTVYDLSSPGCPYIFAKAPLDLPEGSDNPSLATLWGAIGHIQTPAPGFWTLRVIPLIPNPPAWFLHVELTHDSSIQAAVILSSASAARGSKQTAYVLAVDDTTFMENATLSGSLIKIQGEQRSLTQMAFTLDKAEGSMPRFIADLDTREAGRYVLEIEVTGTIAGTPYRRMLSSEYAVSERRGSLTGKVTSALK